MLFSAETDDILSRFERTAWYPVISRRRSTYLTILDHLSEKCDPKNWTMELHQHYFVDSAVCSCQKPILNLLLPYHLKTESLTDQAQGTIDITDKYRCTPDSISLLKKYENFFEIEYDIDVFFYKDETCILFVINHENDLFIDTSLFKFATSILESDKKVMESYDYDYTYCLKMGIPHAVCVRDRKEYEMVLTKIHMYCETISMVFRENVQSMMESELQEFQIPNELEVNNPHQWPSEEYRQNVVRVSTFRCCSESISLIVNSRAICNQELVFSQEKFCVAYTQPRDKKVVIDAGYFFDQGVILDYTFRFNKNERREEAEISHRLKK